MYSSKSIFSDPTLSEKAQRVLDAFFSNKGISYLVDEASAALGNPLFLINKQKRYTAMSPGNISNDDSTYAQRIAQEAATRQLSTEHILYTKDRLRYEELRSPDRVLSFYHDYFKRNALEACIFIKEARVGSLTLIEYTHTFQKNDELLLLFCRNVIVQELEKQINVTKQDLEQDNFLLDLLTIPNLDAHIIEQRITQFHYPMLGFYRVMVIQRWGDIIPDHEFRSIAADLKTVLEDFLETTYSNYLVLLCNYKNSDFLTKDYLAALNAIGEQDNVYIGISNLFTDLTKTQHFYDQAYCVSHYANHMPGKRSKVNIFSDLAYLELFEICRNQQDLMNYCLPQIISLLDYDLENNSDLTSTLYVYIQQKNNITHTANALFVHKNTLLYRLEKIKKIIGFDLETEHDNFICYLSLQILIYLGRFTPPDDSANSPEER